VEMENSQTPNHARLLGFSHSTPIILYICGERLTTKQTTCNQSRKRLSQYLDTDRTNSKEV
jgi:hypothetical protein